MGFLSISRYRIHLPIADIPYMNLAGPDCKQKSKTTSFSDLNIKFIYFTVEPERDHIFYVTFPAEWRLQDLFSWFKQHGICSLSFHL